MRKLALAIATVALAMTIARSAGAESAADANRAYVQGDFAAAARAYESLVIEGVEDEDLYYNLGNAYFRLGDLGRAIFNYERALRAEPGMPDAVYNLEVAHGAVAERVRDRLKGAEAESWWIRATSTLSTTQLIVLFVLGDFLFFGLLIVLRFLASGFRRSVLSVLTGFVGVALLASAVLLAGDIYVRERLPSAIVLPEVLMLREGRGTETAERGQLHAGLRVRVLDTEKEWVLIRLANGVEGWVEARHLGVL